MKAFLKSAILVGSLVVGSTTQAGFLEDLFKNSWSEILKTARTHGAETLCRKGDASQGIFSLRSFNGQFCQSVPVAAFAVMMCGKDPNNGFLASQCYGYAKKALGVSSSADIKTAMVKAKAVLKMQSAKKGSKMTGSAELLTMCQDPEIASTLSPDEAAALCGDSAPSMPSASEIPTEE